MTKAPDLGLWFFGRLLNTTSPNAHWHGHSSFVFRAQTIFALSKACWLLPLVSWQAFSRTNNRLTCLYFEM